MLFLVDSCCYKVRLLVGNLSKNCDSFADSSLNLIVLLGLLNSLWLSLDYLFRNYYCCGCGRLTLPDSFPIE